MFEAMGVRIRDARGKDVDEVVSFASDTWDGWDYVPDAWDDWLDEGHALVAESGGRVIGTVHAVAREEEGWIEGLRVDEDHRREGVGVALVDEALGRLADEGVSVVRGIAFDDNEPALSFLDEVGFDRVATVRHGRGFGFPYGTSLRDAGFDDSLEVVRGTEAYDAYAGLYATTDWRMWSAPVTAEEYEGEILGFVADDEVRGVALCDGVRVDDSGEEKRTELVFGLVWVEPRYAGDFALDVRGEARDRGIHDALVFLPNDEETVEAFDRAGFDFDRTEHVYERTIE